VHFILHRSGLFSQTIDPYIEEGHYTGLISHTVMTVLPSCLYTYSS